MHDPWEMALVMLAILAVGFIAYEMFNMGVATAPNDKFDVDITPSDPLIVAAAEKARATLHRFDALLLQYPKFSSLALGPIGDNGKINPALVRGRTEGGGYLVRRARTGAEGKTVEEGDEFEVQPAEIVDWIVYESERKERIHGGFTLRAVMDIARRDGVYIPKHALLQEQKFVTED